MIAALSRSFVSIIIGGSDQKQKKNERVKNILYSPKNPNNHNNYVFLTYYILATKTNLSIPIIRMISPVLHTDSQTDPHTDRYSTTYTYKTQKHSSVNPQPSREIILAIPLAAKMSQEKPETSATYRFAGCNYDAILSPAKSAWRHSCCCCCITRKKCRLAEIQAPQYRVTSRFRDSAIYHTGGYVLFALCALDS